MCCCNQNKHVHATGCGCTTGMVSGSGNHYDAYEYEMGDLMCSAILREIIADPANGEKEFFIGGSAPVSFTLEYMTVTGAVSPSVEVIVTSPGAVVSKWRSETIGDGCFVKDDFSPAEVSSRLTLKVTEVIARLRWFEIVP